MKLFYIIFIFYTRPILSVPTYLKENFKKKETIGNEVGRKGEGQILKNIERIKSNFDFEFP